MFLCQSYLSSSHVPGVVISLCVCVLSVISVCQSYLSSSHVPGVVISLCVCS